MKMTMIADLHGFVPELEGGDILIVAGDCTARDDLLEWGRFFSWFKSTTYRHKILVAGNHDGFLEKAYPKNQEEANEFAEVKEFLEEMGEEGEDFHYLCDSGVEIEGFKFWGSPYTPFFGKWHFMERKGADIRRHWDMIPEGLDVLITHGPPYGILDMVNGKEHKGCVDLRNAIFRTKPRYHIFGHIHECGGKEVDMITTKFINCSIMNEKYEPVNKPMSCQLEGIQKG